MAPKPRIELLFSEEHTPDLQFVIPDITTMQVLSICLERTCVRSESVNDHCFCSPELDLRLSVSAMYLTCCFRQNWLTPDLALADL